MKETRKQKMARRARYAAGRAADAVCDPIRRAIDAGDLVIAPAGGHDVALRAALVDTLAALKHVYAYESELDSDEAEWVKPSRRAIRNAEAALARPTPAPTKE